MTSIVIKPCTVEDAPALGEMHMTAFWTDKHWSLMWREKPLEYMCAQARRRWGKNLLLDPKRRRHFKAVDERSGAVVGYIRWVLPDLPDSGDQWKEACVPAVSVERQAYFDSEYAAADWGYDTTLDVLDEPLGEAMRRLKAERDYLVLDMLAVHPDARRQGIATRLVEEGLREADKLGFDVFIHGKTAGIGVYKALGFKVVEQLVIDDSKFGGPGEYTISFLVREAKK